MNIQEKIDELYPMPILRMDEVELGSDLLEQLKELCQGKWINRNLKDYDLPVLVEIYYNFIYNNTTLYRDYWRNAIKTEIYNKIKEINNQ